MNHNTPEHLNKCAGCPEMNSCPFLALPFKMRTIYCEKLECYKEDAFKAALDNCNPRMRTWFEMQMGKLEQFKKASRPTPTKATVEPFLLRQMPPSQLN